MANKRRYIALTNGANMFAKAGAHYFNQSSGLIELLEGAGITTSVAGAEVLLNTDADHGLVVGEQVRVLRHRRNTPQAADLIDSSNLYVVKTVPSSTSLTINLTTSSLGNGFGGYVGRVKEDYIRATNVEMVLVSDFEDAPVPQQDRIG